MRKSFCCTENHISSAGSGQTIHKQCCLLPGSGGNTLFCARSRLDNTPSMTWQAKSIDCNRFPWYMGFSHRPLTTTQRKPLLLGWGKGCIEEGKYLWTAGWGWTNHLPFCNMSALQCKMSFTEWERVYSFAKRVDELCKWCLTTAPELV